MMNGVTGENSGALAGCSLVAGESWGSDQLAGAPESYVFRATDPRTGRSLEPGFTCASVEWVDGAARAAARAFESYRMLSGEQRARLLERAAAELESVRATLIHRASLETGLSGARLEMEFARTVRTLGMFARVIRDEAWRRPAIEPATPGAGAGTIPARDLRRLFIPLGPVAVFGASNFPLAYGVAGGDTASALAAGCPVIVKGHPSHPGTGEIGAGAVARAVKACGVDAGVFSYLHSGGEREMSVGAALVSHPIVRGVGFTGSFGGGMALARAAASRREPIPVFAEMGSANPIYVLPGAARERAEAIAGELAASILDSSGQQCTCPGIVFVVGDDDGAAVGRALGTALGAAASNVMLSRRVRAGYRARVAECLDAPGVTCTHALEQFARSALADDGPVLAPAGLLRVEFAAFKGAETLRDEVFGPAALLVSCRDVLELLDATAVVRGSLATGVFASSSDLPAAREIVRRVMDVAGRIVFNGVTTGVRVAAPMVHGGPYPATNRAETSAVGPAALERWVRPVCFQDMVDELLPDVLRRS